MPLLRPRDIDELLERTSIALQGDADRASLGPHGALDRKGRPLIVYFARMTPDAPRVAERFSRVAQAAERVGAEVATPEAMHRLEGWLVFVERASGEELSLADWLQLRPSATRRRLVAERLRAAVAAVHGARLAHGSLSPKHVLVGENGEVVLTGLSLRALRDEIDAPLAADEDGEALASLLRLLLGDDAQEWTDGGFVPPSLAITGTLTLQTPRAAEVEADTVEVPAYHKSSNPPAPRISSAPPPRKGSHRAPPSPSPWRTLALGALLVASLLLLVTVGVLLQRLRALESAVQPPPADSAPRERWPDAAGLGPAASVGEGAVGASALPRAQNAPLAPTDAAPGAFGSLGSLGPDAGAEPPARPSAVRPRRSAPARAPLPHADLLEDSLSPR